MAADERGALEFRCHIKVGRSIGARVWTARHTPRNLAVSVAIEAAELMEHFQWLDDADSVTYLDESGARPEVTEELADVLIYSLCLANAAGIDLSDAMRGKLARNAHQYPVGTP
ncbi:MAG: nucleotide pyrophosphohydrolase [Chloroflexi bacterium]|nr:nucleotide pyrophosphohydrolase [Chloroflexota bacterium]